MTDTPFLLRDDNAGVVTLTLNRPQSRNSLSHGMLRALSDAFADIANDISVRVVILSANGPVFSSGHDLKEMRQHAHERDVLETIFFDCTTLMQTIIHLPKPVIACVHGMATAAGCQLVASCDLAVATEETRFAVPGINIGLFCTTPMVALTRNIPRKHAMHMLMTGEEIDARTALQYGLINDVVAADRLVERTRELAGKLAAKSPLSLAFGKEAFYHQMDMSYPDAYSYALDIMLDNIMTYDAREGIAAFLEKRPPVWRGE